MSAEKGAGTWPSGEPALLGFDKTGVLTRRRLLGVMRGASYAACDLPNCPPRTTRAGFFLRTPRLSNPCFVET